jgi:hypothetical protein
MPQTVLSNQAARTLLLATAIRNNQTLPIQTYNATGPMTFVLPNVGLSRFIRVHFTGTIQAGTSAATAGIRWPFSLFSGVQLIDPSNQTRINAKPWHLYRLMVVKRQSWFYDKLANITGNSGGELNNYQKVLNPLPGGTIGTGSATNVAGFFDIPITLSHRDLRGTFRLDVPNGQTQLILTPAGTVSSTTAGVDTPITLGGGGGTITLTGLQIKVDYYYYDPVAVQVAPGENPQIPWPLDDMRYVHECLSVVTTGLVAGQEFLFTLGTNREYFRLFHWLNNNQVAQDFSTGNFTQRRFLLNANTPKTTEDVQEYLSWYFEQVGALPQDEEWYFNFFNRPWDSNQYGQLQTGVTVAAAASINAAAFLETMRETLYVQV